MRGGLRLPRGRARSVPIPHSPPILCVETQGRSRVPARSSSARHACHTCDIHPRVHSTTSPNSKHQARPRPRLRAGPNRAADSPPPCRRARRTRATGPARRHTYAWPTRALAGPALSPCRRAAPLPRLPRPARHPADPAGPAAGPRRSRRQRPGPPRPGAAPGSGRRRPGLLTPGLGGRGPVTPSFLPDTPCSRVRFPSPAGGVPPGRDGAPLSAAAARKPPRRPPRPGVYTRGARCCARRHRPAARRDPQIERREAAREELTAPAARAGAGAAGCCS